MIFPKQRHDAVIGKNLVSDPWLSYLVFPLGIDDDLNRSHTPKTVGLGVSVVSILLPLHAASLGCIVPLELLFTKVTNKRLIQNVV